MARLMEILQRTISQNPADQTAALEFLKNACESHYAKFVQELVKVLVNVENLAFVRQAAGLQLKNTLASKELELSDVYNQRWIALPADIRQTVKDAVLQTLGTEQRPSIAAQCVSAISCIELPVNGWPDVIDRLMANVTNPASQEPLKESSLEALGYICQDMPPTVMESLSNAILTAIVHGMRADEPSTHVRLAAVNALLNSLEFIRSNFGNEQELSIIMEVTCQASQSADTQIKVVALQCLVKIMSLYYQFMERYMSAALFPITVEAMKSDVQEVALQGIEFWSNVCEKELDLSIKLEAEERGTVPEQVSKHYARGALQYIMPILTETLAKQDEHDDEWIPAKAAGVCIMFLAQCCGDAKHVRPIAIVRPTIRTGFNNDMLKTCSLPMSDESDEFYGNTAEESAAIVIKKLNLPADDFVMVCRAIRRMTADDPVLFVSRNPAWLAAGANRGALADQVCDSIATFGKLPPHRRDSPDTLRRAFHFADLGELNQCRAALFANVAFRIAFGRSSETLAVDAANGCVCPHNIEPMGYCVVVSSTMKARSSVADYRLFYT